MVAMEQLVGLRRFRVALAFLRMREILEVRLFAAIALAFLLKGRGDRLARRRHKILGLALERGLDALGLIRAPLVRGLGLKPRRFGLQHQCLIDGAARAQCRDRCQRREERGRERDRFEQSAALALNFFLDILGKFVGVDFDFFRHARPSSRQLWSLLLDARKNGSARKASARENFASRGIRASILGVARSTKLLAVAQALACIFAMSATLGRAQDSNAAKAHALVEAAIKMTDSEKAVKLLWQATDIDPALEEPYAYLGMYYNSKQDNDDLVKVYQKLVKYQPTSLAAWLNLGEAYMSFSPPKTTDALPCYRKGYELDHTSAMAALRIGEIMAQQGDRDQAIR